MPYINAPGGAGSGSPGHEISYTQVTSTVLILSTTEATGTTIISPGAVVFDGGAVIAEFFGLVKTPNISGQQTVVSLFEGATQITEMVDLVTVGAVSLQAALTASFRFTPTFGSHTYTVTAFATSTTGNPGILGGAGGTGANPPAFIRFTKV